MPSELVPTIVAGMGEFTAQVFKDVPAEHNINLRSASLTTPAEVARATEGADGVVVDYEILNASHIAAMAPSVKVIGYSGTGLDTVDVGAAHARGIAVVYLPGFATNEVADHTVALMLAGLRRLKLADEVARTTWSEWRRVGALRTMSDVTVGLVGLGRIGNAILARLLPFGPRVLVLDPALSAAPAGASLSESLQELLAEADLVSLQVPLTSRTRKLMGAHEFAAMKPDAIFVNASRGGVVDEEALVEALNTGSIGGAALDVVATEPLTGGELILDAANTLLTPHVAWYSASAERRSRDHTLFAVSAIVRGENLPFGVLA